MKQILYLLGIVASIIFISCLIGLVVALPNPHSLSGRVYDNIGNPISNVDITINYEQREAQLQVTTNEWGEYQQDAYNFANGYRDGDTLDYTVKYKDYELTESTTIDISKGGTKSDFTFPFSLGFITPRGSYPSVAGAHKGTITPSHDISVTILETRACEGTGGHAKRTRITNSKDVWEATWNGYNSEYDTLEFETVFALESGVTYNYTIVTGSYPQIIHADRLEVPAGVITCDSFVDANGIVYVDWIPSIRLGEEI
jgi:hypothetical protein